MSLINFKEVVACMGVRASASGNLVGKVLANRSYEAIGGPICNYYNSLIKCFFDMSISNI